LRLTHTGVKLIDFSPCENYVVTASPQFQDNDNPRDPQCIIVWDLRSGAKLRGFTSGKTGVWPAFKWSHDDKYFARIADQGISVYETPSMDLLEKKTIKIDGIKDFCWSPSDPVISYFVPESNDKPATVVLVEIPSRRNPAKRIFSVYQIARCTGILMVIFFV